MAEILTEQGKRKQLIFGDGELKKATLTYMSTQKGSKVVVPVQFNPKEYSISRKASYTDTTGKLQEPHPRNLQSKRKQACQSEGKAFVGYVHRISGVCSKVRIAKIYQ